ncbi:helix-turn-helix domain-containing protein [Pedobacter frigoris]|uniref:Resolvase HTH domain-containing protein n=1 Tax=Pedobacter frigoris TaxID=2571272 RepID=A0A4V5NZS7_9SPHI|nr:hypothetical protein FA047_05795 [Pedobacter frigoris]
MKRKELKEIFKRYNDPKSEASTPVEAEQPVQSTPETTESNILTANIGIHRQYKFDKVKELHGNGITLRQIVRITKLARSTVRKYVLIEQLVKRESRSSTNLEAFINFILQEENRGKTYRELHKTIVQMGLMVRIRSFLQDE